VDVAISYHERTKHHPGHYARALGYMDWATQPNPFRQFAGARQIDLEHPSIDERVTYDGLFRPSDISPAKLDRSSISRLFYDSLAISAWKQAPGTAPWSLRVNPSSGCLHPTEGYLITSPVDGLNTESAVYHYSPLLHALEQRVNFDRLVWKDLAAQLPDNAVLIALTSIYWRESWKYGERAFRYCHHDVGHAIGTIVFAAATLGWDTRLVESATDQQLAKLLGVDAQSGPEAEHPDCLLVVYPKDKAAEHHRLDFELYDEIVERVAANHFIGTPNKLSAEHHAWPIIDEVSEATRYLNPVRFRVQETATSKPNPSSGDCRRDRQLAAQRVIRQRRSAVSMDGRTTLAHDEFYVMLQRTMPGSFPFDALPWRPRVSLALFVHRVKGLTPGLYLLIRDSSHREDLRQELQHDFAWTQPANCSDDLPLVLLRAGDFRDTAKLVSCHQDIAADGAFSLGMLAQFQSSLQEHGASFYPRLFWETGLIGQVLYLEAEAAGIRATGIGCFFDDAMHEVLGIKGQSWQSLYHFTVGGQIEDLRIQTIPPYEHLR